MFSVSLAVLSVINHRGLNSRLVKVEPRSVLVVGDALRHRLNLDHLRAAELVLLIDDFVLHIAAHTPEGHAHHQGCFSNQYPEYAAGGERSVLIIWICVKVVLVVNHGSGGKLATGARRNRGGNAHCGAATRSPPAVLQCQANQLLGIHGRTHAEVVSNRILRDYGCHTGRVACDDVVVKGVVLRGVRETAHQFEGVAGELDCAEVVVGRGGHRLRF